MIMNVLTLVLISLTTVTSVSGQIFHNLDFRQLCDSSETGLCYWDLSWGGVGSVKPEDLDKKRCLQIYGKNETTVGFAEQTVLAYKQNSLTIITVSASIKSDSISGKGAGLNIGLYNKNGLLIANKDMGGFYSLDWIKGTNEWKNYSISVVCPMETEKIKIGAILYGKGTAYFSDYNVVINSIENRKPSKLALQYIESACDTIKLNSLVRDSINIQQVKETALKIAGNAKNYSDCHLAIDFLLESLRPFGDVHSFFMKADEVDNWENEGSQVSKIVFPSYKIIDSCGYITVPPFHGGNQSLILAYADSMQQAIRMCYTSGIKGWIIDLRQNTGGNMEPMIAGLGPLFSSDKLGSLIDVNGNRESWFYKDGRYYADDYNGWTVSKPFEPSSSLPVAVLTSRQTGSSGEIVAISLIGNACTKSFGQPTWGLTTGNGSYELMDGSQIFLASTVMADRNGKEYTTSITPDYLIEDDPSTEDDEIIDGALKWILKTK